METHHQQTAATTMGVAEDETPSSLTSSHPNTNNPNQEGESADFIAFNRESRGAAALIASDVSRRYLKKISHGCKCRIVDIVCCIFRIFLDGF